MLTSQCLLLLRCSVFRPSEVEGRPFARDNEQLVPFIPLSAARVSLWILYIYWHFVLTSRILMTRALNNFYRSYRRLISHMTYGGNQSRRSVVGRRVASFISASSAFTALTDPSSRNKTRYKIARKRPNSWRRKFLDKRLHLIRELECWQGMKKIKNKKARHFIPLICVMLNVFITKLALNNSSRPRSSLALVKRLIIVWVAVIEVENRFFCFYLNLFISSALMVNIAVTACQFQ